MGQTKNKLKLFYPLAILNVLRICCLKHLKTKTNNYPRACMNIMGLMYYITSGVQYEG